MVFSKILKFINLIYPCELELQDKARSSLSATYLDSKLCTDNGKLVSRFYDKR